jgi:hypothetical protein
VLRKHFFESGRGDARKSINLSVGLSPATMSRELIFGHAKSKFQRQFRSPIRSCLNSTRIPKTSALRAAPVKLAYSASGEPNIIIYNSHHTHTHCIYILMEIKFSIKLPGSACPAAATRQPVFCPCSTRH